ncbi:hypothetical protein OM076_11205 [Solirubrobacter ginsenosidimutans]|uniref:Lipoprotein n=1 Tax=Solirubrobacter ginsenosidimutans TaxID=490573 RepID=A0A9X3MTA0_9ACTN|nr:hypothetical protein [Solirubrobacter ginsenosidimutans]MDA0160833.1 hypothetical protein [Solirubrobacter ginsenosidimutans]
MLRVLAACAIAVTFAACAAEVPPKAPPRTAAPLAGSLRFVTPPLVLYDAEQQTLDVWVRLNRPLKHNVGYSAEFANYGASLEAAGGRHDIPGMQYWPLRPTCYSEDLWLAESSPQLTDGQPIEVSLELSDTQRVTGTGTVRVSADPAPHVEAQLGCPRARHTRECHSRVDGEHLTIGVETAAHTSCKVAREVMERVGRWADSGACYEHLCASAHRSNRGFRCEAALNGEASWDIVCRKGRAEVRGSTAE